MTWSEPAKKVLKVLLILGVLAAFVFPTLVAIRYVALWRIYSHFTDTLSNVTGLNQYLLTAGSALLFIPFLIGVSWSLKVWDKRRRNQGVAILLTLFVCYNLGLFYFTKDAYFAFAKGEALKFYALTPEGVKFYDRPGVDPNYGIPLKPVTPDVVRKLKLLQTGEFKPVDPSRVTFFNPITGEAQVWYYRYADGTFEFYDKPGHHPLTGAALDPVTQQIVLEWRKIQRSRPQPSGSTSGPAPGISVRSTPGAAEIYLDWKPRGSTPTTFEEAGAKGLLVAVKDGYQAAFKRVDPEAEGDIEFALKPDVARSRKRVLLLAPGASGDVTSALRGRLIEEGFSVLGAEDGREFQRELERAGGVSNRALRAWARSRFETDLVLVARVQQSSRDLSDQEMGLPGVKEAMKGTVRVEIGIDIEVTDLRSGDSVAAVSAKGAGFGLDRSQSFQKATKQAATESAKLVRQRL